jgi:hypothetical protein
MTRRARNATENAGRKHGKARALRFAAKQRRHLLKKSRRRMAKASRRRNRGQRGRTQLRG